MRIRNVGRMVMSILVDQFNRPIGADIIGAYLAGNILNVFAKTAMNIFNRPLVWPFSQLVDQYGHSFQNNKTIKIRRPHHFGAIRTEN